MESPRRRREDAREVIEREQKANNIQLNSGPCRVTSAQICSFVLSARIVFVSQEIFFLYFFVYHSFIYLFILLLHSPPRFHNDIAPWVLPAGVTS